MPGIFSTKLPADSAAEDLDAGKKENEGIRYLKIGVDAGKRLHPGNYQGELTFSFESEIRFTSPLVTTVHVNNIWEDNPWLFILIIIPLILFIMYIAGIIKHDR